MNVIITGATKGIGLAIAHVFAKHNNTLLLCSRNSSELQQVQATLQAIYPAATIHTMQADVSVAEQCSTFAKWCITTALNIDVLINNAGYFVPGSIHTEDDGVLTQMLQTNLYSAYNMSRSIVPNMIANHSGTIVNICSIASMQAYPNGGSYSISKYAMLGLSNNLREELKPHGIRVTAVLPGAVYTNSWVGSGVSEQRIMEANDVAAMVYTACTLSPQAVVENMVLRPQLGDL